MHGLFFFHIYLSCYYFKRLRILYNVLWKMPELVCWHGIEFLRIHENGDECYRATGEGRIRWKYRWNLIFLEFDLLGWWLGNHFAPIRRGCLMDIRGFLILFLHIDMNKFLGIPGNSIPCKEPRENFLNMRVCCSTNDLLVSQILFLSLSFWKSSWIFSGSCLDEEKSGKQEFFFSWKTPLFPCWIHRYFL